MSNNTRWEGEGQTGLSLVEILAWADGYRSRTDSQLNGDTGGAGADHEPLTPDHILAWTAARGDGAGNGETLSGSAACHRTWSRSTTRLPPILLTLSTTEEVPGILDAVDTLMVAQGYPARDIFAFRLALEEALVNAIRHGHACDPTRQARVRLQVNGEQVQVEVQDQGPGFDPDAVPDPLAPEGLQRPSGRGLLLMRAYLTWLCYNEKGNGVTLCRRRSEPPRQPEP
jgi:serine/threonine-protein kinase RsbW